MSSLCNREDYTIASKSADDVKANVSLHFQFCRNSELETLAIREFFLRLGTLIKHVTFCELGQKREVSKQWKTQHDNVTAVTLSLKCELYCA